MPDPWPPDQQPTEPPPVPADIPAVPADGLPPDWPQPYEENPPAPPEP